MLEYQDIRDYLVIKRFKSGEIDIGHVHEFVRKYKQRLDEKSMVAHSPMLSLLGCMILWFGWLMFNAGSSGGLTGVKLERASLAMINTTLGATASGIFTFFTRSFVTG